MIGFQLVINDEPVSVGGIGDLGVLTAIVHWVRREDSAVEINVRMSGLDTAAEEHLAWVQRELAPGDVVTIRVLDVPEVDEPTSRKKEDPDAVEKQKRRYYEMLRSEYEGA